MIYIEKKVDIEKAWQKSFENYYIPETDIGFWDIESTGLSANHDRFILGGILSYDGNSFLLKQFFSENKDDEQDALLNYFTELKKHQILVSYNGINFDQIFINKRFQVKLLPLSLGLSSDGFSSSHDFFHLDIFNIVRTCTDLKKVLPNLKQKTIETYCGISSERDDLISGGESTELYKEYLVSGDESILKKILLHNSDDCIQLAKLTKIFSRIDIHKTAFSKGFPVKCNDTIAFIENIRLKGNKLEILGRLKNVPHSQSYFADGYSFNYDKSNNLFCLDIHTEKICHSYDIVDLCKLPISKDRFKDLPHYKNDYLLLTNDGKINYMECNILSKELMLHLLNESRYST